MLGARGWRVAHHTASMWAIRSEAVRPNAADTAAAVDPYLAFPHRVTRRIPFIGLIKQSVGSHGIGSISARPIGRLHVKR